MVNSNIEWCDHTHNEWTGCSKVSAGCKHCYAEGWAKRSGLVEWGGPRRLTTEGNRREPVRWNRLVAFERASWNENPRQARFGGVRPRNARVFCGSLMDWLDPEVPIEWLAGLLRTIRATPNLDWLLLTKRPGLWRPRMEEVASLEDDVFGAAAEWLDGDPPPNVLVGASAEDQEWMDGRGPDLLRIPARARFFSLEPLLGPIEIGFDGVSGLVDGPGGRRRVWGQGIHWVIVGGESGKYRRGMKLEWMGSIIEQCRGAGVPVFVKQDNGRFPGMRGRIPDEWWSLKEFP